MISLAKISKLELNRFLIRDRSTIDRMKTKQLVLKNPVIEGQLEVVSSEFTKTLISNADISGSFVFKQSWIGGLDLSDVSISGSVRFLKTKLIKPVISGVKQTSTGSLRIPGTEISGGKMTNLTMDGTVSFARSKLYGIQISDAVFYQDVDFSDALLKGVRFSYVVFKETVTFEGARLSGCRFDHVIFEKPILAKHSKIRGMKLIETTFADNEGFSLRRR